MSSFGREPSSPVSAVFLYCNLQHFLVNADRCGIYNSVCFCSKLSSSGARRHEVVARGLRPMFAFDRNARFVWVFAYWLSVEV